MAATPVSVTCTADTWVLAAQNVTTGVLHKVKVTPNVYLATTVPTGNAAPTDNTLAWPIFTQDVKEGISDSAAIDVYVKAVRKDGEILVVL